MFEAADTPAIRFLAEHGTYRRATSTFPSLTPVCLSSIATGAHPDVHEIPHLVWWHRGEQRIVEYGSSFGAVRAAGIARSLRDTVIDLNAKHLSRRAETIYEALEATGLTAGAINITCYRGTHRHLPTIPGVPAVYGPKRFFFYSLYESDKTGAPIAVRNRALGSIDAYAASVGRWLVTRDGFDFLVYYLPDYDFASHVTGPDSAHEALARSDAADRGADGRRGRAGRVPRALRGDRLLRPRAVARRAGRPARRRRRPRHRLEPRRDGLHRRPARRRRALRCAAGRRHRPLPGGRALVARRDGDEDLALLDAVPGRSRACRRGLAQPECRRGARLGRAGLGVRRPRRPRPPRRRQSRLARASGLRGADAGRRARRAAGVDHRHQGDRAAQLRLFALGLRRVEARSAA